MNLMEMIKRAFHFGKTRNEISFLNSTNWIMTRFQPNPSPGLKKQNEAKWSFENLKAVDFKGDGECLQRI